MPIKSYAIFSDNNNLKCLERLFVDKTKNFKKRFLIHLNANKRHIMHKARLRAAISVKTEE